MIVATRRVEWKIEEIAKSGLHPSCERWGASHRDSAFQAREIAYGLGLGTGTGKPRRHYAAGGLPRLPRS